jgi:hypothetical protein
MLEFLILVGVGACGYVGAPGWLILVGAAAQTAAAWWRKMRLLRQHPTVPFSTKMTTYLVAGIVINIAFAVLSYLAGAALRRALEG